MENGFGNAEKKIRREIRAVIAEMHSLEEGYGEGWDSDAVEIKPTEKVSHYDDAGTLLSKIGDFDYSREFDKIRNMGSNRKVWFLVNIGDKQFLGQATSLFQGWKVVVFDNHAETGEKVPVAKFTASDRFELEEMMHSLHSVLERIASESQGTEEDEGESSNG